MALQKTLSEYPLEELIDELRARGGKDTGATEHATSATRRELAPYDTEAIYEFARAGQEVIYGVDDRKDLFEVSDAALQKDADTVVALFRADEVQDNGDGTSTLKTENFGERRNLCTEEPFRDQPVGAFCSGFLISKRVVATAGHCVHEHNVNQIRFVFGFRMRDPDVANVVINNSEIYAGARLIGRDEISTGPDWALVELDRSVSDHSIVEIRGEGKVEEGQLLHVIGHPSGLPLKIADSATVRDNTPDDYFVANLDTYGGNSGSPVFNSDTHQVEGVLVRGERDFVPLGDCNVSMVCPANASGCRGEDCTRITVFASQVDSED